MGILIPSNLKVEDEEKQPFGAHWCGPDVFEQWVKTLVAVYEPTSADHQASSVYCTAAPARFYEIEVNGINIATATDEHELAAIIAAGVSQGRLNVSPISK